jgi:hypothetical protein
MHPLPCDIQTWLGWCWGRTMSCNAITCQNLHQLTSSFNLSLLQAWLSEWRTESINGTLFVSYCSIFYVGVCGLYPQKIFDILVECGWLSAVCTFNNPWNPAVQNLLGVFFGENPGTLAEKCNSSIKLLFMQIQAISLSWADLTWFRLIVNGGNLLLI